MKHPYLLSLAALCGCLLAAAPTVQAHDLPRQTVVPTAVTTNLAPIPDPAFRAYLQAVFPQAFVGNELDTTHGDLALLTRLEINPYSFSDTVRSLEGLQYFKSLNWFTVEGMPLSYIPALPSTITVLGFVGCGLSALPPLPPNLTDLYLQANLFASLPPLPNSITSLTVQSNHNLTSLPTLPASLMNLTASECALTSLPALPASLQSLHVGHNQLTSLPALTPALVGVYATNNQITSVPALPASLQSLYVNNNQISTLPPLHEGLTGLGFAFNNITEFPRMPSTLVSMYWGNNPATCLPNIPPSYLSIYPDPVKCPSTDPDLTVGSGQTGSVGGDYDEIVVQPGGALELTGDVTADGDVVISSGASIDLKGFTISGDGNFILQDGGTLATSHPLGISDWRSAISTTGAQAAVSSGGAIQVLGTRSFSTQAHYVFNGSTQVSSVGLPSTVASLTVSVGNSLTLTNPTTVTERVDITGGQLVTNNWLTLESNAAGTASLLTPNTAGSYIDGKITVRRYISPSINPGNGYRHVSFPVAATQYADIRLASGALVFNTEYNTAIDKAGVLPFPTIFRYVPGFVGTPLTSFSDGWTCPEPTDFQMPLIGHSVNVPGGAVLYTTDEPFLNSQQLNLTGLVGSGQYLLLGNPFAAPLLWSSLPRTQLAPVIYMARSTGAYSGSYASYVAGTGVSVNGGTDTIPSGQGFFVEATGNSAAINFRLQDRVRGTTGQQVFRQAAQPLARFELKNGNIGDESVIHFHANATAGFDNDLDANRMPGGMALYTHGAGKYYSINSNPESFLTDGAVHTFALGYTAQTAGTHTIKLKEVSALDGQVITLIDNQLGTATVMNAGDVYSFQTAAGSNLTRFVIQIGAQATGAKASILSGLSVFPNPAKDRLDVSGLGQNASLMLINAVGQTVRTANASYSTSFDLNDLAAGVYTLRIAQDGQTVTQKVVKQ